MISFYFANRQWLRITLSLIYLTCIAFLSLLPSADFSGFPTFPEIDKVVHISMYTGLGLFACWSIYAEIRPRWYYFIAIFAIGWGIMMEIFQYFMHLGRSFEFEDILANSVGTLAGVSIYILLARIKKNRAVRNG